MNSKALATLTLLGLTSLTLMAGDWPQFRGPNASGVDRSRALAANWNVETGENIQ